MELIYRRLKYSVFMHWREDCTYWPTQRYIEYPENNVPDKFLLCRRCRLRGEMEMRGRKNGEPVINNGQ